MDKEIRRRCDFVSLFLVSSHALRSSSPLLLTSLPAWQVGAGSMDALPPLKTDSGGAGVCEERCNAKMPSLDAPGGSVGGVRVSLSGIEIVTARLPLPGCQAARPALESFQVPSFGRLPRCMVWQQRRQVHGPGCCRGKRRHYRRASSGVACLQPSSARTHPKKLLCSNMWPHSQHGSREKSEEVRSLVSTFSETECNGKRLFVWHYHIVGDQPQS